MMGEKRNGATHNGNASTPNGASEDAVTEDTRKGSDQKKKHQQDLLDEGIEESFPASDTPTVSRVD